MKKTLHILGILVVVLAFIAATSPINFNNKNLGDIKYSILPPAQFAKQNGPGWTPIDGRSINTSQLHKFLQSENLSQILNGVRLPDARGLFFRNMGQNAIRKVGEFEGDATKMPNNKWTTTSNGSHRHLSVPYEDTYMMTDGNPSRWSRVPNSKSNGKNLIYLKTGDEGIGYDYDNKYSIYLKKTTQTNTTGNHSHNVLGGDLETRPKNVAFYAYIKVN